MLQPEPKTLDEARGLVTADYQTYLEKEWIKELKEKYPVAVNEDVLEKVLVEYN
jgi:peptidyl-prolyl cis-trans isomerase SurA